VYGAKKFAGYSSMLCPQILSKDNTHWLKGVEGGQAETTRTTHRQFVLFKV
jgi:hypothetical protein